ncbi:cytochrome o ubiquinol oxidase subunit IV [Buchnera aphidicola (Anoecia oenotherae)]|uniref:Cytochrome bo(3) ubiquinol oxidase subunit 4 n=2 Tax=Buchnera aphidicola TaxID=9 RepID=A0A4D6XRK8_9GAMM|nr:cytochrome o ubiquinol oxidase subunit IV [Buchnera aphidicola (Anoecia oenotherae)]
MIIKKHSKEKNNFIKSNIYSYFFGFIFSVCLSFIPFFLIEKKINVLNSKIYTNLIILLCCCLQIFFQIYYFLHLKDSMGNFWNIVFLLFTFIIMLIIIIGSTWIMYNLHYNVMIHQY